jgi:hypothetical protein
MKYVLLAVAAVAAATTLASSAAGAQKSVRGVVVSRSHGRLLVATRTGRVVAEKGRAAIGSRVVGRRVVGHARRARIHGVVVLKKGSTMFVASNHHLVAIHKGRSLAGVGSNSGPAPGTILTSTVTVNKSGLLNEDNEDDQGQDSDSTVAVQAVVDAVGQGTVTLNVNGTDVTFDLPAGLTLPQSIVGQTVTINVSISGDDDNQGDE